MYAGEGGVVWPSDLRKRDPSPQTVAFGVCGGQQAG
jgi:hypothetical protein